MKRPIAAVVLVGAGAGAMAMAVAKVDALNIIAASLLVFLLPGASLLYAIDFRSESARGAERLFWSVLSSLAIAVIGGLILNVAGGLTRRNWCILLGTVVLIMGIIAFARTLRYDGSTEPRPSRERSRVFSFRNVVLFGCSALFLAAALGLSQISTARTSREHFVQLWMLPRPFEAANAATSFEVGVRNLEAKQSDFLVTVSEPRQTLTWTVELKQGESWSQTMSRPSGDQVDATVALASTPTRTLASVHLAAQPS
jgi:hypothetical protein